jgi:hypothetical protein
MLIHVLLNVYRALRMGNVETVLSSSISWCFFAACYFKTMCGMDLQQHQLNLVLPRLPMERWFIIPTGN